MVFVSRMVVPKVERRVRVPEKHRGESSLYELEDGRRPWVVSWAEVV